MNPPCEWGCIVRPPCNYIASLERERTELIQENFPVVEQNNDLRPCQIGAGCHHAQPDYCCMDEVFIEAPGDPEDEEWVERAQSEMLEYFRLVETGEIKLQPDYRAQGDCVYGDAPDSNCDWPNCKCDEVNCNA